MVEQILKLISQPQLHLPRILRRGNRTEVRRIWNRHRRIEIRVIQKVEPVEAQLQLLPLAHAKVFLQREITVPPFR